ncbi:MAG: DsrE family protein [Spirochaetales bacterium]|jgi:hypothetical protein|nr:DsrE family protein [Spirochaetales bacterium]
MNKTILFAFRGDPLCFIQVLLNSQDMATKNLGGEIILEGEAVKLVAEMAQKDHFLHPLYIKAKIQGLIIGACRACSNKLGVSAEVEAEGIELIGTMAGHPSMADYINQGYTVITF